MNFVNLRKFVVLTFVFFLADAYCVFSQSFQGLGDLPGGTVSSLAMDVSADGKVVVGVSNSGGPQAFRWTSSTGMKGLGFLPGGNNSYALAVSADGSVVTGWSNSSNTTSSNVEAFRWVNPGPMVGLGDLLGGQFNSWGEGIASNGGIIVGKGASANTEAFLWVFALGMTGLGHLPGGTISEAKDVWFAGAGGDAVIVGSSNASGVVNEAFYYVTPGPLVGMGFLPNASSKESEATAISANGKVIVGWGANATSGAKEAFRYVYPGGPMQGLGFLPAPNPKTMSTALDVSSDGSVVVGAVSASSGNVAFIWDATNGMRDLKLVLMEHYGLDLTGWKLETATGISDDGKTIVGGGTNPNGQDEAWIARLSGTPPAIPSCFDFNQNSTQGWTIDQIYNTSTGTKKTPTLGFVLHTDQNQLAATANHLVIDGHSPQTELYDIYLESPDLTSASAWQTITGYSLDIKRIDASLCGDPPNTYFAQLQMRVIDTTDNSEHLFAENDGTNFVFHNMDSFNQQHFVWKPQFLSDPKYKVKSVRVRLTGAGEKRIECGDNRSWLIDNVCAETGPPPPPPESLTLTSPNGGETWQVGSSHNITWTSQNLSNPVKIEYSINNGSSYTTIVPSTSNDGSFNWTIPNTPSANCLVRVSDATDGNPSDVSNAKFEIVAGASLTVTSPNGGEKWQVGSSHNITWSSQNLSNPVKIEYSVDNGSSYTTVAASTSNDGSYNWTIPNNPSTNCLVRVSDATDGNPSDVSNAKFEIVAAASITVTSPNGGETWGVGSQHNITWTSQNLSNPVKIKYSTNNGASYTTIVASTSNDGSHPWTIPNTPSANCLVRISDATDGNLSDVSDAVFTISSAGNTPTGTNVEVDVGNGVKVTFDNVTSPGETTLDVKTSGPPPPSGFKIMPSGLPVYFDIKTSASRTGNITICIPYNDVGMTPTEEAKLRLYVYEVPPGKWKDITKLPVDTANNIICGTINHLTVFAMMLGPVHFSFASNTGESYSVVIDNATLDGNQLVNGDEIGVFTPAGLCVGASVWDGTTPLALTAWADDSQTNGVDGYNSGDKMSFRIWDAGAGTQDDYPATPTYSAGNGNFGAGAFAHLSLLEAVTSVTQALSLPQGWSWLSFNVEPQNRSMESVLTGVANLVIVVNNAGQFYIPNVINSIGNWSIFEGYKIYVSAPDQVSVTGKPVTATTPIALKAGWNFVSYLPATAMSAETALASVLSQLSIVKNDAGKFFIPNVINSLGNMTPGEGYKLYLNADATLTYPQGSSPAKGHSVRLAKQNVNTSHFAFTQRTGDSFSIIVKSNGQAFKPGDEIGIFTAAGLCVGAGVCDGSDILGISAWADDDRSDVVDGFREGEKMRFKLWDANKNRESTLEAIVTSGSERFDDAPFTVVELASPTLPTTFSLGQNYPNPFNAGTVISYQLPASGKVTLTVYNLLGERVRLLLNEQQDAGAYSIHWDGKDREGRFVPSGVYLYRIQVGNYSAVRKAVFVK